jgi:hypothetical protein
MSVYIAPFTFDFGTSRIRVDLAATELSVIDLYAAIREARATEGGILYDAIATGSGLVDLGAGTKVGLTVALLGGWQIKFQEGAYVAKIAEGNLVGGPGDDPIAYSAGVQILLIQSAASTVVEVSEGGGGGATPSQVATAVFGAELHPGFSFARLVRIVAAAVAGKSSGGQSESQTLRSVDDTTDQVVGTVDNDGNRTSASYGP